jgi:hypothetical protein
MPARKFEPLQRYAMYATLALKAVVNMNATIAFSR